MDRQMVVRIVVHVRRQGHLLLLSFRVLLAHISCMMRAAPMTQALIVVIASQATLAPIRNLLATLRARAA